MTEVLPSVEEHTHNRLRNFSPLRYPGGKGKLAHLVKRVVAENELEDGVYAEPFAGGAAVAFELLLQGYVSEIHINDLSLPIYAFWRTLLDDPSYLIDRVLNAKLTVEEWDTQKSIMRAAGSAPYRDLGFATFYLNRTNRSGVLNAGVIGGRAQTGKWLIDARFNASELAYRIERLSRHRDQVSLSNLDAIQFLRDGRRRWPSRTLIYLDPPYYEKGRDLYLDFYVDQDHEQLAAFVRTSLERQNWIVSYDNVPRIRELYLGEASLEYSIGYSVRSTREGKEVMFFSSKLNLPLPLEEHSQAAAHGKQLSSMPPSAVS